jgi:hypothetical protein
MQMSSLKPRLGSLRAGRRGASPRAGAPVLLVPGDRPMRWSGTSVSPGPGRRAVFRCLSPGWPLDFGKYWGLRKGMGGRRSGRSAGRATTDDGLSLSLPKLLRDRLFRSGCAWGASLVWTDTTTGDRVGSIGYEADLGQDSGRVRLKYTSTRWDGERRELEYWIQLENNTSTLWRPRHVSDVPMSTGACRFAHRLLCVASLQSSITLDGCVVLQLMLS